MRMRKQANGVIGGVDTHKDSHAVVALDLTGQWLGWAQFPTNPTGYRELLTWLRGHGTLPVRRRRGYGLLRRGAHTASCRPAGFRPRGDAITAAITARAE